MRLNRIMHNPQPERHVIGYNSKIKMMGDYRDEAIHGSRHSISTFPWHCERLLLSCEGE